jgi:purine catabolism regulator
MLTVRQLSEELGLPVLAGEAGLDAPLRWVHISEMPDPTPWLSGGELLLMTGDRIGDGVGYVHRLADYGLAALAIGLGVEGGLQEVPPAMLEEAEARGFPLLEVPLPMPFLAITERAAAHLVNDSYATLQRAMSAVEELQRVALAGAGPDAFAQALSAQLGAPVSVGRPGGEGLPVGDPPQATLLVDKAELTEFDRLLLRQAVTVLALELLRARVAAETERRLAGDVLASMLSGDLQAAELRRRLAPFGLREQVAAVVLDPPAHLHEAAEAALHDALRTESTAGLAAATGTLACALVPGGNGELVALAERLRARVSEAVDEPIAAGVGRPVAPADARRTFHQARFALEARRFDGRQPGLATSDDLGSFQLLLSLQDGDALRLFCDSILAPLEEGQYGEELLRSLEVFIEANGSWERAARRLDCHRHTLRYRIRRVEELTGRSLDSARDRIDFWLALRGREVLS